MTIEYETKKKGFESTSVSTLSSSDSKVALRNIELQDLIANRSTAEQFHEGLLQWVTGIPGCAGACIYQFSAGQLMRTAGNFSGPAFETSDAETNVQQVCQLAYETGKLQSQGLAKVRNVDIVSAPFGLNSLASHGASDTAVATDLVLDHSVDGSGITGTVAAAFVLNQQDSEQASALLLAAAGASLWAAKAQISAAGGNLDLTATTLDLLTSIESSETIQEAAMKTVNGLRERLKIRGMILGLMDRRKKHCQIAAMSGLAEIRATAALNQCIENVFRESISAAAIISCTEAALAETVHSPAHQKLLQLLQVKRVISHPLITADENLVGVWLALEDGLSTEISPPRHAMVAQNLLRVAAPRAASALNVVAQTQSRWWGRPSQRRSWLQTMPKLLLAAAAVTLVLMLPVPYTVHCECSAEPDVRRFIVAPTEGLVEHTLVESGDVVEQGQLLAIMDGRSIRWELAGLTAEKEQASQERDTGLLEGDAAEAQRATLELQRIAAREHLLLQQKKQLDLNSPISGIVLDGHLERVENAPVTIGQAIYEIAPLSPVCVEVAIHQEDFSHVKNGADVVVTFDGLDQEYVGTIQQIHPRSEVIDGNNVFVAEVTLDNEDQILRPGMAGFARVDASTQSLGWSLFHKPWEHFRETLPF